MDTPPRAAWLAFNGGSTGGQHWDTGMLPGTRAIWTRVADAAIQADGAHMQLDAAQADIRQLRDQLAAVTAERQHFLDRAGTLADEVPAITAERDMLRRERDEAEDENRRLLDGWPKCPDGCGCRIGTEDADLRDCGCDGPCTMECRENGYPEAASYRDIALADLGATARELMAANEGLGDELTRLRAAVAAERDVLMRRMESIALGVEHPSAYAVEALEQIGERQ